MPDGGGSGDGRKSDSDSPRRELSPNISARKTGDRRPPPPPAHLPHFLLSCFTSSHRDTEREGDKKRTAFFGSASLSAQQGRRRFENLAAPICQLLRVTGQRGPPARTGFANSDMGRKKTGNLLQDESPHVMQNVVFGCLWPSDEPHRKREKFILYVFWPGS